MRQAAMLLIERLPRFSGEGERIDLAELPFQLFAFPQQGLGTARSGFQRFSGVAPGAPGCTNLSNQHIEPGMPIK